jgi:DNA-binding winged helix-turn-helix (wHTH) protein/TolB-like protein
LSYDGGYRTKIKNCCRVFLHSLLFFSSVVEEIEPIYMQKPVHQIYYFDKFTLDLTRGCLLRENEPIKLRPKSFQVLKYLVENYGRLITKEELFESVWTDSFVTDDSLVKCVNDVRHALGDEAQHIIKTVPRRGYIFEKEVKESDTVAQIYTEETTGVHLVIEEAEESEEENSRSRNVLNAVKQSKRAAFFLSITLVAATVGFYFLWLSSVSKQTESQLPIKSIAVLPFKSLKVEAGNEYLEAGMADALITRLSNIRQITVRPTRAILKYTAQEQDLTTAGRELKVDSILDGSIQKLDDKLRVTVQLVRVSDGSPLWAEQYDEPLADLFSVQNKISERVTRSLALQLSSDEQRQLTRRSTSSAEAYENYLKGRFFWNKRTEESLRKAVEFFNQAIAKDPNYAQAYAGLADCYALLPPPRESMPKAKAAAMRALELDDTLADAHTSLAHTSLFYDWDFANAEREFQQAIQLNPNYATAHHWYALLLAAQGRQEEALAEITRAQEIDPLSLIISTHKGLIFYLARRYDEAIEQQKKTLELEPNFLEAHYELGRAYAQKKMYQEAIAELRTAVNLSSVDSDAGAVLGYVYAVSGKRGEALRMLDELNKIAKTGAVATRYFVFIHAGLSNNEQALELLEKEFETHAYWLIYLKSEPILDNLRSDVRFANLERRVGITP